jgi:hypothetical protein
MEPVQGSRRRAYSIAIEVILHNGLNGLDKAMGSQAISLEDDRRLVYCCAVGQ